MNNTALSATHMDNNSKSCMGGVGMIKVRLQGTRDDMAWLEKQLEKCSELKIMESSEAFRNKGTNKYFRKYLEVKKNIFK